MPIMVRRRLPWVLGLIVLLLFPVSCSPFSTTLGNDPCLLRQYQSSSNGYAGGMSGAYNHLVDHVDALQGPNYTISAQQNISDTLNALSEFETTLNTQQNLIKANSSQAQGLPQARAFTAAVLQATQDFTTGANMLAQAYLDAGSGDLQTAQDIADVARDYMLKGHRLLTQATNALSTLNTNSVNC